MSLKHLVIYTLLAAVSGGLILLVYFEWFLRPQPKTTDTSPLSKEAPKLIKTQAHLYFARRDNTFLVAEKRDIYHQGDTTDFAIKILEALIIGPRNELMRTVPANTSLRAFYLSGKKTAVVDMNVAIAENHPGGIQSELLSIYSIVNSLVLNIASIESVKILINGYEPMTLSGHVDLRNSFKANMLLVR